MPCSQECRCVEARSLKNAGSLGCNQAWSFQDGISSQHQILIGPIFWDSLIEVPDKFVKNDSAIRDNRANSLQPHKYLSIWVQAAQYQTDYSLTNKTHALLTNQQFSSLVLYRLVSDLTAVVGVGWWWNNFEDNGKKAITILPVLKTN